MTDPQVPPVLPPSSSPASPPPTRGSTGLFVVGILVGLVGALVPAASIAAVMGIWGGGGKIRSVVVCVCELAGFGVMLLVALRSGRHGLAQGVIVGGALAFLLCAACWGLIAFST